MPCKILLVLDPHPSPLIGNWAWEEEWPWEEFPRKVTEEETFYLDLMEGSGFLQGVPHKTFDDPTAPSGYDPIRCGVFADWLQDNEDRLLAQIEEQDRPLAAERLSQLRDWLRSGFQKSS